MDKLSKFMPLVVVVVLLAIGGVVILSGSDDGDSGSATVGSDEPSSVVDPVDDPDEPAEPAEPVASSLATIQGEASYPSDALPNDYEACARPVAGGEDVCTSEFDGADFSIEVEAGEYTVYAISPANSYVAFYDQCTTEQTTDACPRTNPNSTIVVDAVVDAPVSGANPSSWYGPDDYAAFIAR